MSTRHLKARLAALTALVGATGCGLNIASLEPEHLPAPVAETSEPVTAAVSVSVETAEQYHGRHYEGQVSVEPEVIRGHVIDAIRARGFTNLVDDPETAEYQIEAKFVKLGLDGVSTRVGFASTWILYRGPLREPLSSEAVTAEESVSRVGWGKGRFREAAARTIVQNIRQGLDALEPLIREGG